MTEHWEKIYQQQICSQIPRMDGPLWPLVERCLTAERSSRWESFEELRGELEALWHGRTQRPACHPKLHPKTAAFWSNRGASFEAIGQYLEAARCCERALELDPGFAAAWNNKANSLRSLGRFEEAARCCERALELDPGFAAAWNNKANSLYSLGRFEEAARCCERALELDPCDALAWFNRAVVQEARGDRLAAIEAWLGYLKVAHPDNQSEQQWLAQGEARLSALQTWSCGRT
jgi:tetratricopeptide (TPR) repeat protein